MEKQGPGPAILRFVRNVGIIIVGILVLASLSCLPVAAWRTIYHLGHRVMLLGIVALVMGMGSLSGRLSAAADPLEQLPHGRSSGQRIKQWVADSMSSRRFAVTMGIAGFVSLILGDLIRRTGLSVLGLP
jgi:hypothetical protein